MQKQAFQFDKGRKNKMKKIISILLIAVVIFIVTSCNMNPGIGTYNFKKVHILSHDGSGKCFEISSWREADVGCEVKLKTGGSLWLSEGTYILVQDKCPICDHE